MLWRLAPGRLRFKQGGCPVVFPEAEDRDPSAPKIDLSRFCAKGYRGAAERSSKVGVPEFFPGVNPDIGSFNKALDVAPNIRAYPVGQ